MAAVSSIVPKKIWRLHDDAASFRVEVALELFEIERPGRGVIEQLGAHAKILRIGFDDSPIFRVNGSGDQKLVFLADAMRHQNSLGYAGAAVVQRRIRDFHSRQLSDVGLKFEYCL